MVEDIVAEVSARSKCYSMQFHYAHLGGDIHCQHCTNKVLDGGSGEQWCVLVDNF